MQEECHPPWTSLQAVQTSSKWQMCILEHSKLLSCYPFPHPLPQCFVSSGEAQDCIARDLRLKIMNVVAVRKSALPPFREKGGLVITCTPSPGNVTSSNVSAPPVPCCCLQFCLPHR